MLVVSHNLPNAVESRISPSIQSVIISHSPLALLVFRQHCLSLIKESVSKHIKLTLYSHECAESRS